MFRFKQFAVSHDKSSMKVGTDAVLLGTWCDFCGHHILDIGTGCGVIALMAAQRTSDGVFIDAVDIDGASVEEAAYNFSQSPWAQRLNVHLADINSFEPETMYDCIVTNPPFFTETVLPPDAVRSVARHTQSLTFEQLMNVAARRLSPSGHISLITPTEAYKAVTAAATFAGLHLSRETTVYPIEGGLPRRLLWQWSKTSGEVQRDTLTIHDSTGQYTEQYAALCRDFYLKF